MKDQYGREITYMRISVTDRCNYRCKFCMPDGLISSKKMDEYLSYEELMKVVKAAILLGIHDFRITGGEPLIRDGIENFIADIKHLDSTRVFLSTNGFLLEEKLPRLIKAGLDGVNVSLSSTDPKEYEQITGTCSKNLKKVKSAIYHASKAGIHTKINCVPIPGMNEKHLADIALFAKENEIDVRFIEMMPIGLGKTFDMIDNGLIREKLEDIYGSSKISTQRRGNGPAVYYTFSGFLGSIGFISAKSCGFCDTCNRIRLTYDGRIKLCLNYEEGSDIRTDINQLTIEELSKKIKSLIQRKPKEHNFIDQSAQEGQLETRYMAQIGG